MHSIQYCIITYRYAESRSKQLHLPQQTDNLYFKIQVAIERLQLRQEMTSRLFPIWKKVARIAREEWHSRSCPIRIIYKLDAKKKAQYAEKVSIIKGEDPYALNKAEFSRDTSHLPSLGCVYYYWLTVGMQPSLYSFSISLLLNCICKILNGDVLLSCSYST